MQWLIDIAKDAMQQWIYDNGIYRENTPSDYGAWGTADFITDAVRHTKDISAELPANTKAVNLSVIVLTPSVNSIVRFFHPDTTPPAGWCIIRTQVADINFRAIQAVAVNANGEIDYSFSNVTWTSIGVKIRGIWL